LAPADRSKLLSLPFKLVVARHRFDVLNEPMLQRLLEARRAFRNGLRAEEREQIEFFDTARYFEIDLEHAVDRFPDHSELVERRLR
jgi:putative ABC transport system ATP-binding protein